MDFMENPTDVVSMASVMLLLLLNTHRLLLEHSSAEDDVGAPMDDFNCLASCSAPLPDVDMATKSALHLFRLQNCVAVVDEDLGYWVKPRSTTWFSKFILQEYDDSRWVQMFRMTKRSVLSLSQLLAPHVKKQDTKYQLAVPVTVRIACTLFKLSHGASLLICSELFAIGRSTVSKLLREVVHVINVVLRSEIAWPSSQALLAIARDFEEVNGLPGIAGAIDGTHFSISKPRSRASDYFYFKSGGYSMACQAVVDSNKRFLDLNISMPGSTNDSRVLRRSTLFERGQRKSLWDRSVCFHGFSPYLVADAGYPLLSWMMVPHRRDANLSMADRLFNRKLSKARVCVENAFALMKMTFRELHGKLDLNVKFLPDVVVCCAILHNVLLQQTEEDVERMLQVIRLENRHTDAANPLPSLPSTDEGGGQDGDIGEAADKRRALNFFLFVQRIPPT